MNNNKIAQYLQYVFFGFVGLEVLAESLGWESLHHFAKPMLIPILLVYFRNGLTGRLSLSFIYAVFALVFSFIGDSFMMYADKKELYFLIGLVGFIIAQLLYTFSFAKAVDSASPPMSNIQKILYAIPFALGGAGVLVMIWPGMSVILKIPICIYTTLIVTMTLYAVYRNGRADDDSVKQVILGAVFFMLSDVLLAIDRFHTPMANAGVFIMIPYVLAQWNIINGLQKHYNN